jgi:hypothetical protein
MDLALVTWAAAFTAIGSLVTGYTLSRLQHRQSTKDAGITEVAAQMRLARFEEVRKLNGEARSLSHCISHLMGDPFDREYQYGEDRTAFYIERARELSAGMRELARSEVYVLGGPYVAAVHEATDIANFIIDLRVYRPTKALMNREIQIENKWLDRVFPNNGNNREFGHLAIQHIFEYALCEVFTLAAAPDMPSPDTRHNARTMLELHRSGTMERSQLPERQGEKQEPPGTQGEKQGPSNAQHDLPLRLEKKVRSPEP